MPEPGPPESDEPRPALPQFPELKLVDGDRHEPGVNGCGVSFRIGTGDAYEDCGPSFQAPGPGHIVRVRAGAVLRFEIPGRWSFESADIGWVTTTEAVRWRSKVPDLFLLAGHQTGLTGSVLKVKAPPRGDWTILITWFARRGTDWISWPDYFRVVVE